MAIWTVENPLVDALNALSADTMVSHLGIKITEIGDDFLRGTMPVDSRTVQPMRLLHGGASVALAESLGSLAATLCVDTRKYACVGLEINANHVRAAREGTVTGTATPVHIGRRTQIWQIKIENEAGQLICISRLTLAVIDHPTRPSRNG